MASQATTPPARDSRGSWLFGPWTDLLLGCGLAYILTMPLLVFAAGYTGTKEWPALAIVVMAFALNSPHYGATLLRVYQTREERSKYVVFSVWITLALAVLLVVSTRQVWLASLLLTAYVTWSPWHFAGQNYGLAVLFLRRRGIDVDPSTKRMLHLSFVLSALLAITALHTGQEGDVVYVPSTLSAPHTPTIFYLSLPDLAVTVLLAALSGVYLACLVGAGWRLCRKAPVSALVPAALLVATQALWYTVPVVLLDFYEARNTTLVFAAVWISTVHSLQYLWVTAFYARDSNAESSVGRFFFKCLLAGSALDVIPLMVLAPQLLGGLPVDVGLAATLFAVTNLHHFILDGAVWKLRDGRVARVLIRSSEDDGRPEPIDGRPRGRWIRHVVWTLAALSIAVQGVKMAAERVVKEGASPDRIDRAIQILRWTGHEGVALHFGVGVRYGVMRDYERSAKHLQRSIDLFPTAKSYIELAGAHRGLGDLRASLADYEAAIELNPDFWLPHMRRAEVLLELDPERSDPDTRPEAIASVERALEHRPGEANAAVLLARLYAEAGRREEAARVLNRAMGAKDTRQFLRLQRTRELLERGEWP